MKKQITVKSGQAGFTLIELILYVAITSIFITGAIFFAWDIIYGRQKAIAQQVVKQNAQVALSRIAYEIRRSNDIQSVSSNQIVLDNSGSTTTITLSSGVVVITTGGVGPYNLTSNQVEVTDLSFTDLSTSGGDTKDIDTSLTLRQAQTGVSAQFTAEMTLSQSVELNGQFNEARSLLINASSYQLSSLLEEVYLQNLGSADIVLDKIIVSWTGAPSANIKEVKIDNVVLWQGEESGGTELDLTDHTIVAGADAVDVEKIDFDQDLSGEVVTIEFILSDGSLAKVIVDDS